MYRIHIKKEVATTLPFTKVFVDGERVGNTNITNDNSFDSDKYEKDLYLKGILFKTNTIKTPNKDSVYNLSWKQNYIYTALFVVLLIGMVFWAIGDSDYTIGVRIIVMFLIPPLVNFVWNDLLILGRKIEINRIGD